jgi:hypothetical protein
VTYQKKLEAVAKAKKDGAGADVLGQQLAELDEQAQHQPFGGAADRDIVPVPAAGWANIGKKPGMWSGKKAKEEYKQKTKALDPVIDDAWGKMKDDVMPTFFKGVPYAEKKWKARQKEYERAERAKADLENVTKDPNALLKMLF